MGMGGNASSTTSHSISSSVTYATLEVLVQAATPFAHILTVPLLPVVPGSAAASATPLAMQYPQKYYCYYCIAVDALVDDDDDDDDDD
eukprot:CAMPEP_0174971712 /NCGR_PEP_ID=MMETSP0004_2-20121128/10180_1 /TAXON_ID=420556 /ORGANISM="Ochromonas sp., Strain CCMP1393" /LENGTH=87 /DNA_ID=CAMNT_0016221763 /DNA_START=915 /DNA_END=1175 /DNA_ORIENTATION=+